MLLGKAFSGRVIFDHMPKTAGQAVNTWLRSILGTGCVTDNLIGKHRELIKRFGGEYSIISGHVEFLGEGLDPRYDYVTVIRHPIDRTVSWMYFVLNNHSDNDIPELRAGVRAFIDSEGEDWFDGIFTNAITDHLCSVESGTQIEGDKRIDHAWAILEQYALWGLYERLPEFVSDFSAYLHVPAPSQLGAVNVTRSRPKVAEISPRLRAKIEELNEIDMTLYERLCARYNEARKRWQRPSVFVSRWNTMPERQPRVFSVPEFALIKVLQEGGTNVNQGTVLSFSVEFSLYRSVEELECGIHIFDEDGAWAFGTNTTLLEESVGPLGAGTHEVRHVVAASLPEGSYTVGFTFVEKFGAESRELAWFDKLSDFQVILERHPSCVGYSSLPASILHLQKDVHVVRPVSDGMGRVDLTGAFSALVAGQRTTLPLTLYNASSQDWYSLMLNPINLSYHWYDERGECIQFDGVRTALPEGRLLAGRSVSVQLGVESPSVSGRYRLAILPVIEHQCWLDQIGFTPGELWVNVCENSSEVSVGQGCRQSNCN